MPEYEWLKAIGTAGGADKVALAAAHGYDAVIDYRAGDFVPQVTELTGGKGVVAVYDSVGADTWRGSPACLQRHGTFVNVGQSSGPIAGCTVSDRAKGSLFARRPPSTRRWKAAAQPSSFPERRS